MAAYVPTLKTQYKEQIVPALMKEFGYTSIMQCPKLEKIVINQGMGQVVNKAYWMLSCYSSHM